MARTAKSPVDVAYDRVREIALRFPAADEKLSHGCPSFHVRGKMFLMFVGEAYGRGGVAVWCKATLEEQRARVAGDAERYFVPPYVGVKGWVGVSVDPESADWIDLSILVEDAWRSVAPPRIVRGEAVPERARAAPVTRVTTDPKVARAALDRLKALCLELPEAECEVESKHATFRVRKKVFAYFLDNHHGDGFIAACVRGDKRDSARAIAADPKRFYLPQYIGPRGYLGVRLDDKRVDWKDVARRVRDSYRAVAPKSLRATVP